VSSERENAADAEDRSEQPAEQGTRRDIGVGSADKEVSVPDPAAATARGPAGSLSDAAVETGTEDDAER
jgi:hypothetical protein